MKTMTFETKELVKAFERARKVVEQHDFRRFCDFVYFRAFGDCGIEVVATDGGSIVASTLRASNGSLNWERGVFALRGDETRGLVAFLRQSKARQTELAIDFNGCLQVSSDCEVPMSFANAFNDEEIGLRDDSNNIERMFDFVETKPQAFATLEKEDTKRVKALTKEAKGKYGNNVYFKMAQVSTGQTALLFEGEDKGKATVGETVRAFASKANNFNFACFRINARMFWRLLQGVDACFTVGVAIKDENNAGFGYAFANDDMTRIVAAASFASQS